MEQRPFGRTGLVVAAIGQGTWRMEGDDRARAVRALRAGLDAGMTHVDTAEMYGSGEVEEVVREALGGRRDEAFLVTKVWPEHATREGVVKACERSLSRLGTDRLDCYLLHWPSRHPLEETIAGFEDLVRAGKIRSWGLSNFDRARLEKALAIAGEGRIACNQVLYHVGERAIEHAVLPWCAEHGVSVVAYSPFGSGVFPSPRSAGGKALEIVAAAHGATPHQAALAFLLRHPGVFVIPKASDPAHAAENAGAAELDLEPEEIERLEAAFPLRPRRDLPMM
ncbi:MAG TPA: aldo/keto reductase [Anaeromyxobacteraceae bacterium]|nr:aldo/keto reductase [Anaeromyxobacteraceae bacterium]